METYQMVGLADENGKTYISDKFGTYSKEDGFKLKNVGGCIGTSNAKLVNALFHEGDWKLKVDKRKMTIAEIEKTLGYEIDIVDEKKKNEKTSADGMIDDRYNSSYDLFNAIFGGK